MIRTDHGTLQPLLDQAETAMCDHLNFCDTTNTGGRGSVQTPKKHGSDKFSPSTSLLYKPNLKPDKLLIIGLRRNTVGHRIKSTRVRWHDSTVSPHRINQFQRVFGIAAQFPLVLIDSFKMNIFEPTTIPPYDTARRAIPLIGAVGRIPVFSPPLLLFVAPNISRD